MKLALLLLLACAAGVVLASSGSSSSSSSSSSSRSEDSIDSCVKLVKWNAKYEKILHETVRDLKKDRKAARDELADAKADSRDLTSRLKRAWKLRCGVGCEKAAQWAKIRDQRKKLVAFHDQRLAWFRKLKVQLQQLKASGQTAKLAAIKARLAKLGAKGLFDVLQGMLSDSQSAYQHAKAKVAAWRAICKKCRRDGKQELSSLKDMIASRRSNAAERLGNAERRIATVKRVIRTLRDQRARRASKYQKFNFHGCKHVGRNKYKCNINPTAGDKHMRCYRFFKCSEHAWHKVDKKLYARCTV